MRIKMTYSGVGQADYGSKKVATGLQVSGNGLWKKQTGKWERGQVLDYRRSGFEDTT